MINWTQMSALKEGDWGLFDPQYGPEKIVADPQTTETLTHHGVVFLTVCDERKPGPTIRQIVRGSTEGVIVVAVDQAAAA